MIYNYYIYNKDASLDQLVTGIGCFSGWLAMTDHVRHNHSCTECTSFWEKHILCPHIIKSCACSKASDLPFPPNAASEFVSKLLHQTQNTMCAK